MWSCGLSSCRRLLFLTPPITYYMTLSTYLLSIFVVQPVAHPHGFLLHSYHHQSSNQDQDQPPVLPCTQPAITTVQPIELYYYHKETAKNICYRLIRHVFNCPSDSNQPCKLIAQSICRLTHLRHSMGICIPGYPQVIPVSSRVPAYIIPAGSATRGSG